MTHLLEEPFYVRLTCGAEGRRQGSGRQQQTGAPSFDHPVGAEKHALWNSDAGLARSCQVHLSSNDAGTSIGHNTYGLIRLIPGWTQPECVTFCLLTFLARAQTSVAP